MHQCFIFGSIHLFHAVRCHTFQYFFHSLSVFVTFLCKCQADNNASTKSQPELQLAQIKWRQAEKKSQQDGTEHKSIVHWITLTQLTNDWTTPYSFVSQVDWRQKSINTRKQQRIMPHLAWSNRTISDSNHIFLFRKSRCLFPDSRVMNKSVENNVCLKCWGCSVWLRRPI